HTRWPRDWSSDVWSSDLPGNDASIGEILGAALAQDEIIDAVEKVVARYLVVRESTEERFIETVRRVGLDPFKQAVYGERAAAGRSEEHTSELQSRGHLVC